MIFLQTLGIDAYVNFARRELKIEEYNVMFVKRCLHLHCAGLDETECLRLEESDETWLCLDCNEKDDLKKKISTVPFKLRSIFEGQKWHI